MNGFEILLMFAALLVGVLAGAVVTALLLRSPLRSARAQADTAAARLAETQALLAAAEAEKRMLDAHNRQLTAEGVRGNSVLQALAPVAEKLSQVQAQVGLLERDRVEQFGQLAQQLQEARFRDQQLLLTTESLASALRSNTARGAWGEIQLRRVVEAAGMLPYVDFAEQVTGSAPSEASGGPAAGRPDMIIRLPGTKHLIVDAKVPLAAFLQASELPEAASQEESARREELLARHAKALKSHVDGLAKRRYWDGIENSPELVVCFLPAESFLSAALRADPALLDYAFARNVVLASPVSLLATLKAVAFSWRQDVLTDNAKELFALSRQLYERLGTMGEHVTKLGTSLKSSVERYNSFVGNLESRVLPTARRIGAFQPSDQDAALHLNPVEATPRLLSAPELLDN